MTRAKSFIPILLAVTILLTACSAPTATSEARPEFAPMDIIESYLKKVFKIINPNRMYTDVPSNAAVAEELSSEETLYQRAVAHMEAARYPDAMILFQQLDDYRDSRAQVLACEEAIYQTAIERMERREYADARQYFHHIEYYKDSLSQIQTCLAKQKEGAVNMMNAGHYRYAMDVFLELAEYGIDCSVEITECEKHVLEENGPPIVTHGNPVGQEITIYYTVNSPGNITVHSITRVNLDNDCIRFTIDCTTGGGMVNIFNPPNGDIYQYYDVNGLKSGRQTLVFDVMMKDLKQGREMTINLANNFLFIRNPY